MAMHDGDISEVSGQLAAAAYELGNLHLEEGNFVRAEYWLFVAEQYGAEGTEELMTEFFEAVRATNSVKVVHQRTNSLTESQVVPEQTRATGRIIVEQNREELGSERTEERRAMEEVASLGLAAEQKRETRRTSMALVLANAVGAASIVIVIVVLAAQLSLDWSKLVGISASVVALASQLSTVMACRIASGAPSQRPQS